MAGSDHFGGSQFVREAILDVDDPSVNPVFRDSSSIALAMGAVAFQAPTRAKHSKLFK